MATECGASKAEGVFTQKLNTPFDYTSIIWNCVMCVVPRYAKINHFILSLSELL